MSHLLTPDLNFLLCRCSAEPQSSIHGWREHPGLELTGHWRPMGDEDGENVTSSFTCSLEALLSAFNDE